MMRESHTSYLCGNIFFDINIVCDTNYGMRTRRTTPAVLREKIGIKDFEMAKILNRSKYTVHALESGRLKLSPELAKKFFHETGISPVWLLNGDPNAPMLAANGDPYEPALFEKAQAEKIYYDRPHPFFRNTWTLGVCAQLIAILESAAAKGNYYMAQYKVQTALDSLRGEFGEDKNIYEYAGPSQRDLDRAIAALKKLLADYSKAQREIEKLKRSAPNQKKKRPLKKRRKV